MPVAVNETEVISQTVSGYKINAFAVDLDRKEIMVAYKAMDELGQSMQEEAVTIDGPGFVEALADIQLRTESGADVYSAMKGSFYAAILARKGKTGIVS